MKITKNVEIIKHRNGSFVSVINGIRRVETDKTRIADIKRIHSYCWGMSESYCQKWLDSQISAGKFESLFGKNAGTVTAETPAPAPATPAPMEVLKEGIQNLMDFFKEFEFEPNFRFLNTLSHSAVADKACAKKYINSYFELIDSPYKNEIREKVKSREFDNMLTKFMSVAPTKKVNNRFKIYYGSQGTGKTTIGQTESENRCVVCNASMLPADLMEDFVFDAGKPSFNPSILWDCMEQGKAIVLDEINLLPFDSLRFLQGILDGKTEFNYKGRVVHINEGFCIIGTMNLSVNGMVYGLPEPLVDRCMEMKKFALTADQLINAVV